MPISIHSYWLLKGHMTSNKKLFPAKSLWAYITLQNVRGQRVTVPMLLPMNVDCPLNLLFVKSWWCRRFSSVWATKHITQQLASQETGYFLRIWDILWKHKSTVSSGPVINFCSTSMTYSQSSPNGHPCKQTALLMAAFTKPCSS